MDNELKQQSGQGMVIIINEQTMTLKPLRLREIVALDNYRIAESHGDIDMTLYNIRLHLRDNNNVNEIINWLLDLPPKEATTEMQRIVMEIDKLYPSPSETKEAEPS